MQYQNRIRELRKQRKLSMQVLADRIGTSNQQIYRLEKGLRQLTQKWMLRIASGMNVDPRELISPSNMSESVEEKTPNSVPAPTDADDNQRSTDELVQQLARFVDERIKAVNQFIDRGPSHYHLATIATEGLVEDIRRILSLTEPSKSDPTSTSSS